ncbi:MAG: DUF2520 domain-containing protein [Prevotella sp.]|nr:DUF2520 domain-containing protein [Prevotella sp.]
MVKAVLVGAGNVATHLGKAIVDAGDKVVQVYSRTLASAATLAEILHSEPVTVVEDICRDADIYIISVKDDVLPTIIASVCKSRENCLFAHTAGSVPMNVFEGHCKHYGVIYPLQTFSKDRELNFREIPLFVEAVDEDSLTALETFSNQLSSLVFQLSSPFRSKLHLSAVFACNFVNHCYALAAEILKESGLPFDVLLPLIDETCHKVRELSPVDAQTGPAVRWDKDVMARHREELSVQPLWAEIYEAMSQSIHELDKERNADR